MKLPSLSPEEFKRYSRHLLIPEVGLEGQQKLKAAAVLVVGTGGLGSPISLYLAAAGVGRIGLVDFDTVDYSNLQRQVIHATSTVDQLKVQSARDRLIDLNPDIQVDTYNQILTSANARQIAEKYDLILDGTDNFPTRYLLNDLCVLTGKTYIYGSIFRFDGQVSVFDSRKGPCYRCLFPEPPPPASVPTCAEGGVFGVLPGVIGALQASEAIKLILGIGEPLIGKLLLYNALDQSFDYVELRKNPACKVCGVDPEITDLIDYNAFCGVSGIQSEIEPIDEKYAVTVDELVQKIKRNSELYLLDVREPHEARISNFPNTKLIPLDRLPSRLSDLNPDEEIIVFCRAGIRSKRALDLLIKAGFKKVKHLKGGINQWARTVDHSLPIY
jgi:sulfur-carrier protein adenylyltransferase/sulfurtransferase